MKGRRPCLARKEEEGGGDRDLAFALTLSPLTDEEREEGAGGRARALPPPSAPSARPRPLSSARYNLHSAGLNKARDIHILDILVLDVANICNCLTLGF